jgi:hypothetical protein
MFRRLAVIGLFAMGVVALVPVQASAAVCLVKNGSTCVFWSGSVSCDNANASGLGNVTKNPKYLGCGVQGTAGLIVCGNPGANQWTAPGIQLVTVPVSFGQIVVISANLVHNGYASTNIIASASDSQLASLTQYCPNSNWTAIDYVPVDMTATVQLYDEDYNYLGDATYQCTLPDWETLTWDTDTQSIERRQYDCERVD